MRVEDIQSNLNFIYTGIKLNNDNSRYSLPLHEKTAHILNPDKFKTDIKDTMISLEEIKALLLMMTPGIKEVYEGLIRKDKGIFVDVNS